MKDTRTGGKASWRTSRQLLRHGFKASLAVVLAASMSGVFSTAAYAADADLLSAWAQAAQSADAPDYQPFTASDTAAVALADDASVTEYPKSYDLRDQGVVTPVKFQNPWGTCWGFATIAACETSILSESGKTYADTGLDLSELQLARAVYLNGGAPESIVGKAQAGEGYHSSSSDPNLALDSGGWLTFGVNVFASGIGPALESDYTYKNNGVLGQESNEPVYVVVTMEKVEVSKDYPNGTKKNLEYLTQAQIDDAQTGCDARLSRGEIISWKKRCYAGNYKSADGKTDIYTDWSIETQQGSDDLSWWNTSLMNLENGNELPDTRILDENGSWTGVNWASVAAIKDELYNDPNDKSDFSRAVSVCFSADNSTPGDENNPSKYISTDYAHYTYDDGKPNHAVTIVGWDDNYDASNFAKGFSDTATHTPEGDGAWLVKNSWGSETGDCFDSINFPSDWGFKDENGNATGYFWISYYDHSLQLAESYDFDINSYNDNTDYVIDQYDYLAADDAVVTNGSATPIHAANVFTAESDMDVRALSAATYKPNTTVTFQVFKLADGYTSPSDGELLYTTEATYDYAGYHRLSIDEDEWIALREGDQYSVVTTGHCNDDEQYYTGVAVNTHSTFTEAEEKEKREQYAEAAKQVLKKILQPMIEQYYSTDDGKKALAKFREEHPEYATEEEALAAAIAQDIEDTLATKEMQAQLQQAVDSAIETLKASYFVGVVNEGESFTGQSLPSDDGDGATGDTQWYDWTGVVKQVNANGSKAVDNPAIKAVAEIADYATVAELEGLEAAIAQAKALLASVYVSADGSNVATDKQWMTQEDYDALKAAIAEAEECLANAGADYKTALVRTTDSSDTVFARVEALTNGMDKARAGLFEGVTTTTTTTTAAASKKGKAGTPSTGDATSAAAVALVGFAGVASVGAYASRRRRE